MKQYSFAIITLNWNGYQDTVDCVDSIIRTNYSNCDIFCLDNGSENNEYVRLRNTFKRNKNVRILNSKTNLGFAGGNNYVNSRIKKEKYDFIILLNNDTIVKNNFFSEINFGVKSITMGKIGFIVPTIYYFNKKLNEERIWRANDYGKRSNAITMISHPVGCVMVVPSEVLEKYGLFKEEFFAYGEEVEYSYRLKKAGLDIYYFPDLIVWHKIIEHKDSQFKIYMVARNKWYYWESMKIYDKLLYLPYLILVYNLKKIFEYGFDIKRIKTFFKGNIDGLTWIIKNKKPKNIFLKNE